MNGPLPARLPRVRLWMKLAAFAAAGVVLMHAVHLSLGNRIARRAVLQEHEVLGRTIARLVARQATDPLLVGDAITLYELVTSAVAGEGDVAYCFVVKNGRVLASSFGEATPPGLVALRPPGDQLPVIVRNGDARVLDLVEPILDGDLGEVRLGLDMSAAAVASHHLAVQLGLLAVGMIVAGVAAALLVGREIARPVDEILAAADRFDPAREDPVREVSPRGTRETAVLGVRFNRMMHRLRAAHAEQARARQKSVETERLVALGSLVAGVAHEVNNPLAGLKNCLRRLELRELPDAKRREYLDLMEEGLSQIEDVVRQLLDFGRPHPPRPEPVPVDRIARESAALLRPELDRRRIRTVIIDDAAPAPAALADRRLVEQAIVNLVLNAAYVTAEGGEIRLRLRRRAGELGIAVEDDGPGIPSAIRDRILDPFFSTKPEGEGTGLGLSVTRTIVDAHGGELTFEFPPAGGTVATVWLKAAAPARASA